MLASNSVMQKYRVPRDPLRENWGLRWESASQDELELTCLKKHPGLKAFLVWLWVFPINIFLWYISIQFSEILLPFLKFYRFLSALVLCRCVWASSSCRARVIVAASLVEEHRLWSASQAQQLWSVARSKLWGTGLAGLWHVGSSWARGWTRVPALTGGCSTTGPPGEVPIFQYLIGF